MRRTFQDFPGISLCHQQRQACEPGRVLQGILSHSGYTGRTCRDIGGEVRFFFRRVFQVLVLREQLCTTDCLTSHLMQGNMQGEAAHNTGGKRTKTMSDKAREFRDNEIERMQVFPAHDKDGHPSPAAKAGNTLASHEF